MSKFIYFSREESGLQHERLLDVEQIAWCHFCNMPPKDKNENKLVLSMKNGSKLQFWDKTARQVWVHLRKTVGEKI